MNEKAEDIKQLKQTVKKVYQLSKEIDSLADKKVPNKELIAKFKRERSLHRFLAQQQAANVQFEQKKAELMAKDFKAKTREIEAKQLQSSMLLYLKVEFQVYWQRLFLLEGEGNICNKVRSFLITYIFRPKKYMFKLTSIQKQIFFSFLPLVSIFF
jgi:hypothetical protein